MMSIMFFFSLQGSATGKGCCTQRRRAWMMPLGLRCHRFAEAFREKLPFFYRTIQQHLAGSPAPAPAPCGRDIGPGNIDLSHPRANSTKPLRAAVVKISTAATRQQTGLTQNCRPTMGKSVAKPARHGHPHFPPLSKALVLPSSPACIVLYLVGRNFRI